MLQELALVALMEDRRRQHTGWYEYGRTVQGPGWLRRRLGRMLVGAGHRMLQTGGAS